MKTRHSIISILCRKYLYIVPVLIAAFLLASCAVKDGTFAEENYQEDEVLWSTYQAAADSWAEEQKSAGVQKAALTKLESDPLLMDSVRNIRLSENTEVWLTVTVAEDPVRTSWEDLYWGLYSKIKSYDRSFRLRKIQVRFEDSAGKYRYSLGEDSVDIVIEESNQPPLGRTIPEDELYVQTQVYDALQQIISEVNEQKQSYSFRIHLLRFGHDEKASCLKAEITAVHEIYDPEKAEEAWGHMDRMGNRLIKVLEADAKAADYLKLHGISAIDIAVRVPGLADPYKYSVRKELKQ